MISLQNSRILVVAPHPDDEILGCGGLLARCLAEGIHVSVCVIGYRVYNHEFTREDGKEQRASLTDAAEVLGNGGYQISIFPFDDEKMDCSLIKIIRSIEDTVKERKPTAVFLPWKGDTNQDHKAVHHAGLIAAKQVPNIFCYEVPSSTEAYSGFVPNFYVNISGGIVDKKIEAMLCYDREVRDYPHPRSEDGLCSWAEKRGMECGCEAAEAFMMIRGVY